MNELTEKDMEVMRYYGKQWASTAQGDEPALEDYMRNVVANFPPETIKEGIKLKRFYTMMHNAYTHSRADRDRQTFYCERDILIKKILNKMYVETEIPNKYFV